MNNIKKQTTKQNKACPWMDGKIVRISPAAEKLLGM